MQKILFVALGLSASLLSCITTTPPPPPSTPTVITKISAGAFHSLGLKSDGTVLAWGRDNQGQLGDGFGLDDKPTPVPVSGAIGIIAVAAGGYHSLALKSDGTVLAWGSDARGQLGNNAALDDKPTPVPVLGATNIIAISAGYFHSLALKSDGTMLAWGWSGGGQIGDGSVNTAISTPVPVLGATGIIAISAGGQHSLALKSDNTVLAWGVDSKGQLGDDAALNHKTTPVPVLGLTAITAISAGGDHSLARKSDGTMLAWGSDDYGQLGDDATLVYKPTPVSISGTTSIAAISAGAEISLALKSDNTVFAWGQDDKGQLGNDVTLANNPIPVSVSSATSISAISAGGYHSLALKSDGKMLAWGYDDVGQLGDDTALINKPMPVSVFLP